DGIALAAVAVVSDQADTSSARLDQPSGLIRAAVIDDDDLMGNAGAVKPALRVVQRCDYVPAGVVCRNDNRQRGEGVSRIGHGGDYKRSISLKTRVMMRTIYKPKRMMPVPDSGLLKARARGVRI